MPSRKTNAKKYNKKETKLEIDFVWAESRLPAMKIIWIYFSNINANVFVFNAYNSVNNYY